MNRCYWAQVAFWNRVDQAWRILRTVALVVAPFVVASWIFVALGITGYSA